MTDDYALLVARLREASDNTSMNMALLREAADAIERLDPDAEHNSWRNSEIRKLQERVRELEAVEKAARAMADKYSAPNVVNDEPCDLGEGYCRAHEAEFDERTETCPLGALRSALS